MRRVLPLIALVAVTNLVMLASVRPNRAGEPDALVRLTQRELRVERSTERDSVPRLWLFATENEDDRLLDGAKLTALGLDCPLPASDKSALMFCARQLPRRVFAVYEFDGPAWQRETQRLEARRKAAADNPTEFVRKSIVERVDNTLRGGSRLLAVDAGLDAASLRRAYPDGRRYLILPVALRATVRTSDANGRAGPPMLAGRITPLTTELIARRDLRRALDQLAGSDVGTRWLDVSPRYYATIAVGSRHEPWVVSIEPFDTPSTPH